MNNRNLINLGLKISTAKVFNQRTPFQIFYRVIEQCNLNCTYCEGDYPRVGLKQPKLSDILTTIDGLAQLGTQRITIIGGEPLLRRDIGDIIARIKQYNINCSLTTNGKFIKKHIKALKHIDLLGLSLDDNKEAHESYRGDNTFKEALEGLKIARQANIPVQLMCVLTDRVDPHLKNLLKTAEQYDCVVDFDVVNPNFNGKATIRSEDAGKKTVHQLLDYLIKNPNQRVIHNAYAMNYVRNWPVDYATFNLHKKDLPKHFKPIPCQAGQLSALIESNGDLMPCCIPRPDYNNPINVYEKGIKFAWQNMPENTCVTCRSVGFNTLNSLFESKPKTIWHHLKWERKRKKSAVK